MQNNPLHISLFPAEERAPLEFQLLLSTSLDIFEARLPHKTADQDFGLLQAVDERLAMYGWLTNTGVKIIIVVDMEGRPATALDSKSATAVGLRDADMKPVGTRELKDSPHINLHRHSEHFKQHISCCCEILFTTRMSIHQLQPMLSKELGQPKSRVGSSFKRLNGLLMLGLLASPIFEWSFPFIGCVIPPCISWRSTSDISSSIRI